MKTFKACMEEVRKGTEAAHFLMEGTRVIWKDMEYINISVLYISWLLEINKGMYHLPEDTCFPVKFLIMRALKAN